MNISIGASKSQILSGAAILLALSLAHLNAQPPALSIARVTLSADGSTLFIYGDQFGSAPAVTVGAVPALDVVVDPNGTTITVPMPQGLPPGMYRVSVDRRPDGAVPESRATFFVVVPGDGQSGVQGPPGPPGALSGIKPGVRRSIPPTSRT